MTAEWAWRSVPGVRTEMDRDYQPQDEREPAEQMPGKPGWCAECWQSFGHAAGCPADDGGNDEQA